MKNAKHREIEHNDLNGLLSEQDMKSILGGQWSSIGLHLHDFIAGSGATVPVPLVPIRVPFNDHVRRRRGLILQNITLQGYPGSGFPGSIDSQGFTNR